MSPTMLGADWLPVTYSAHGLLFAAQRKESGSVSLVALNAPLSVTVPLAPVVRGAVSELQASNHTAITDVATYLIIRCIGPPTIGSWMLTASGRTCPDGRRTSIDP